MSAHQTNFLASQAESLVTDRELAEKLRVSQRFIHVLRARGQLRAVKLGNAVRFPLQENMARVLGNPDGTTRGGHTS